jgi:hypothetical protein
VSGRDAGRVVRTRGVWGAARARVTASAAPRARRRAFAWCRPPDQLITESFSRLFRRTAPPTEPPAYVWQNWKRPSNTGQSSPTLKRFSCRMCSCCAESQGQVCTRRRVLAEGSVSARARAPVQRVQRQTRSPPAQRASRGCGEARAWLSGVMRRRNSTYSSEWKYVISSGLSDCGRNTCASRACARATPPALGRARSERAAFRRQAGASARSTTRAQRRTMRPSRQRRQLALQPRELLVC